MRPPAAIALTAAAVAIAALVSGVGPDQLSTSSDDAASEGIVASVVDGDTIHLTDGRRIRLVQIDTPEVHPRTECGGPTARDALREKVARGDTVALLADPKLDAEDQHGRLLRYVLLNGENLNVWMVEHGHAHPYFFRGDRGRHADALLDAVHTAQRERRGLWGDCPDARLDPNLGA